MHATCAITLLVAATALAPGIAVPDDAVHSSELIFPLEELHNHGSCIVQCPNGDLLVCWFRGSGERTADDVQIMGARKVKLTGMWTPPFVMGDTPGFPDTNCCMIIDTQSRLWLFWPTILAHRWETAVMNYKISVDYQMPEGPPVWQSHANLFMKPGDDFASKVKTKTNEYLEGIPLAGLAKAWVTRNLKMAEDKLTRRLGWFTRAHPFILDGQRMLVGLYSDGFSFSLVAYTDDWGQSWNFSEPIVGGGNIQPSFALTRDGSLLAYMRDNGPPPKRVMVSQSSDRGRTWSKVHDHPELKNPGSGLELANLAGGRLICVYNDTAQGRHSLAVSISEDDGATWPWTRHLERAEPGRGRFHYPSIIQSRDGRLHVSYSYFVPDPEQPRGEGKSIKHAEFSIAWVMEGHDG